MKIRQSLIWILLAAGVMVALLIWFGKPKQMSAPLLPADISSSSSSAANASTQTSNPSAAPPSLPQSTASVSASPTAALGQNKAEKMVSVLSNDNDVPIVFFGKLEDQFSKPVPDAVVDISVTINNGHESTTKRGRTTSDAEGLFTVSGYKGEKLSVVPRKAGFALASTNGGGYYSRLYSEEERVHPDQNAPVVIKMWKLQGAEPLLGIDQHYKLHYTDVPIYFDLVAGKIVTNGGDLKLSVFRPNGIVSERNPQDWGFKIEVVEGGLIESSGQSTTTYQAPESGYAPSETLTAANNAQGVGVIQQGLFIQSRNGHVYSKLTFTFSINSTPEGFMSLTFSGVANTNGSRNWEATAPR